MYLDVYFITVRLNIVIKSLGFGNFVELLNDILG